MGIDLDILVNRGQLISHSTTPASQVQSAHFEKSVAGGSMQPNSADRESHTDVVHVSGRFTHRENSPDDTQTVRTRQDENHENESFKSTRSARAAKTGKNKIQHLKLFQQNVVKTKA